MCSFHAGINDPCDTDIRLCGDNAVCMGSDDSYTCTCMTGYSGNGTYCYGKRSSLFYVVVHAYERSFSMQIWMNVKWSRKTAQHMLFALTPLAVTHVHAKKDTLAMGFHVVGVNTSVKTF